MTATAVLPVKRFDAAKQRLAGGIEAERRRELAGAMVADVLEAIGEARAIERLIVVSGEPLAQELAAEAGAEVVADPEDAGHVEAARAAGIPFGIEELPSIELDLDTPGDVIALTRELAKQPKRARRTAKALGI